MYTMSSACQSHDYHMISHFAGNLMCEALLPFQQGCITTMPPFPPGVESKEVYNRSLDDGDKTTNQVQGSIKAE